MSVATIDDTGGTKLADGPSTSAIFSTLMLGQPSSSTAAPTPVQCTYCGASSATVRLQPCLFCGSVAYCSNEHQKVDWNQHKMICKSLQSRGLVSSNLMPVHPALPPPPPAGPMTAPTVTFEDPALTASLLLSLRTSSILNQAVSSFPQPTFSIIPKIEPEPIPQRVAYSLPFSTEGSAFKPYRNTHVFNSLSSESISSMGPSMSQEVSLDHMSTASFSLLPTSNTAQTDINQLATVSALNLADSAASLASLSSMMGVAPASNSASLTSSRREPFMSGNDRIIPTDDPDIQIIETDGSTRTHVSRTRKRPTPSNSAEPKIMYKDHNKNTCYSTTLQEHQKHLQNRGLAVNIHQAMVLRLRYIAEHVIRSLNEFGWAVVDNFLGSEHYKFTANEIERLYSRGLFSPGQLMEGKNKDEMHIKDIRSDHIYWYNGGDQKARDASTVRLLISMIDAVVHNFKNRIDHEISGRSRAMLAIYPGNGTRYVKHVDNPAKDGRCITTIYYCNENWNIATDGGNLRLYPETSMNPMEIDPRADRLVFFWSDRRNPHEVKPVYRHRFAITIWYMDKSERERCLAAKKENDPATSSPSDSQLGTPTRPRKNPSTHDLSPFDLRLFPTAVSDPTLTLAAEDTVDSSTNFPSTSSLAHPESTDSGVSLSTLNESHPHHHHMPRSSSLQSLSDHFRDDRSSERRSSTSSDQDLDEGLPPPPSTNPEYYI